MGTEADDERAKRLAAHPLGHLLGGHDTRTPEQKAKESARRAGRRKKDWWKKYPPTDLR